MVFHKTGSYLVPRSFYLAPRSPPQLNQGDHVYQCILARLESTAITVPRRSNVYQFLYQDQIDRLFGKPIAINRN